jgi:Tol biopolymer transport system component
LTISQGLGDIDGRRKRMQKALGFAVAFSIIVGLVSAADRRETGALEGPYLGQEPPGDTPSIFAPGIVSTEAVEACLSFSFDGRYLVFRRGFRDDTEIFLVENTGGRWNEAERAPFFVKEFGFGDFTFSPNRPELYFTSRRPLAAGGEKAESADLWKVEYENGMWKEPTPLGSSFATDLHESYPSVANDNTLYFFRRFDDQHGRSDIMRSEFENGAYSAPKRMGPEINTAWDEWDPSISPDGDFLVFCSKKPSGFGEDDLYVSFRSNDGGWTDAINLGEEINSQQSENRPVITADGKYLFFNSNVAGSRDVYWVDLDVVRALNPR